jgi:hypothetical protein
VSRVRASYAGDNPDYYVIKSTFRSVDGAAGKAVQEKSARVMREMRRIAPIKSGRLLMTIRREVGAGPRGPYADVYAGARGLTPYLGYVLYGTLPHKIRARRRRMLRFYWTRMGGWFYGKQVQHPGSRANNFMQDALHFHR